MIDPALAFQLEMQLQIHLTVGTQWMHNLGEVIEFSKWSSEIPQPKKKQKELDCEEDTDNSGGTTLHEVIEDLEIDDQHAQFLNVVDVQEEDEVERLLGKVAEQCEELALDFSGTQEDITSLFN